MIVGKDGNVAAGGVGNLARISGSSVEGGDKNKQKACLNIGCTARTPDILYNCLVKAVNVVTKDMQYASLVYKLGFDSLLLGV